MKITFRGNTNKPAVRDCSFHLEKLVLNYIKIVQLETAYNYNKFHAEGSIQMCFFQLCFMFVCCLFQRQDMGDAILLL